MEHLIEEKLRTPVVGAYDVIIVGSGPSGFSSAVSAARKGVRVLLIESGSCVGGMSTSGLMSHFTGDVDSRLYQEILDRAYQKNISKKEDKTRIDPELLKNTYLEMLTESGVELLLYTFVCDVIMDNERVKGVITESKSGRCAYLSEVVIDCTGDGDVAYYTGAEFVLGRESDHKMQPATLMLKVGGVDMARAVLPPSFETTVETPKGELQELAKKHLPFPAGHVLLYSSPIPGIVTVNMTNAIGIDGTKAEDMTKAELQCRSQMEPIVAFLREYVPGFEACYIISAASQIGIRETRHFAGAEKITEQDILEAHVFDNWIVRGARFEFDVHNMTGASLDKTGVQKEFPQKKGYTIPYGCIIPKEINGLLLSGRNISGTHLAHASFRSMPICVAIGEACGIAAALAVKGHTDLRNVDPHEVQACLAR